MNQPQLIPAKPTDWETMTGYVEHDLRCIDGTVLTATKILQVGIHLYPKLQACLGDECAEVEFYTNKPHGWALGLSTAAHETVITEGRRLNEYFFGSWLPRRRADADLLRSPEMELFQQAAGAKWAELQFAAESRSAMASTPVELPLSPAAVIKSAGK